MSTNLVIISGNVGQEPKVKTLPNGNLVTNFSIATNQYYLDNKGQSQQSTQWHNIVGYGNVAKRIQDFVKSGTRLNITGHLVTRTWMHPEFDIKMHATEIIIDTLDIISNSSNAS